MGAQRDLEQVVVERLLGAGGYSLAPLEYKTFASHRWPDVAERDQYALALLCHASTLHTNCLTAGPTLAAVDAVKPAPARCRPTTRHRVGGGGGRARLSAGS